MQRRHQVATVPTEILRSVVAVAEHGSISKAARFLGLSQPAISAQMKRIEETVGGSIFHKTANGSQPSDLGKLVLVHARKILEANQQLLLLRGSRTETRGIRLGIDDLFSMPVLSVLQKQTESVGLVVNCSAEIAKSLLNGFVDLALYLENPVAQSDPSIEIIREIPVEMSWVRSRDFVISPGAPIPLLTWAGQVPHHLMVSALERQGLIYRIAFSSPELHSRIEAAQCGIGLTALPTDRVPDSLIEAKEYYLPRLDSPKLFLARRVGSQTAQSSVIERIFQSLFVENAGT